MKFLKKMGMGATVGGGVGILLGCVGAVGAALTMVIGGGIVGAGLATGGTAVATCIAGVAVGAMLAGPAAGAAFWLTTLASTLVGTVVGATVGVGRGFINVLSPSLNSLNSGVKKVSGNKPKAQVHAEPENSSLSGQSAQDSFNEIKSPANDVHKRPTPAPKNQPKL